MLEHCGGEVAAPRFDAAENRKVRKYSIFVDRAQAKAPIRYASEVVGKELELKLHELSLEPIDPPAAALVPRKLITRKQLETSRLSLPHAIQRRIIRRCRQFRTGNDRAALLGH
jgi:hypothetical protein